MKTVALIFLLFSSSFLFSQTQKVKVKKEDVNEKKQSELPFITTICDKYSGNISRKDLFSNNEIKISNNNIDLAVINFEVEFRSRGKLCSYWISKTDTSSLLLQQILMRCDTKSHIIFHDIKAVSKKNDTILLNPISLKIID